VKVTALITAYNCERFIGEAVDSALAQDYEGLLEVLVVDDGCTDGTAAELAKRPVRVIRQPNAGYVAATERGVAEARGDLVALLDGDDAWPRDKLSRQVEALGDAGLIYGDMTVIDADGRVVDDSWLGDATPPHTLADWLHGNAATSSSIVLRTELARRWCPLPRGIAFVDWYFALRAAQESEVVYLAEPRTLYRFHGDNMSLGSSGPKLAQQLRAALVFQRYFLRRSEPGEDAWAAWQAFEEFALELQRVAETPFTRLVPVSARDREVAREELALGAPVRALAADPWCSEARAGRLPSRPAAKPAMRGA
jgi:glycosyltransferase involved in cell wall biosynthesis